MTTSSLHTFNFSNNGKLNAAWSASLEVPRQTSRLSFSWSKNYEALSNSPAWNKHHLCNSLAGEDLHLQDILNSERVWRENELHSAATVYSRPERLTFLATCQTTQAWPYHNNRQSTVRSELEFSSLRLKRLHPDSSLLCQPHICDDDVQFNIPAVAKNITLEENNLRHASKRLKTSVSRCSRTRLNASLASSRKDLKHSNESASLRKAKFFRNDVSFASCDNIKSLSSTCLELDLLAGPFNQESGLDLPPTQPSSPISGLHDAPIDRVPVIAPPDFNDIPPALLSLQDGAENRMKVLLTKEWYQRTKDGLYKENSEYSDDVGFSFLLTDNDFGIQPEFRRSVIEWILTVCTSSKEKNNDLHEQLSISAETRFFAAYLFSRFFFVSETGASGCEEGFVEYTLDIAVACVGLSVKMLRDTLCPLKPVTVQDFIKLAPHKMTYHEFELAQRDVLETVSYNMQGNSPQPFLEELWNIIPAMGELIGVVKCQKAALVARVWVRLYDTLLEPAMLCIPISTMVACALQDTIAEHVKCEVDPRVSRSKKLALEGFVDDMLNVLGISMHDLLAGQKWLGTVKRMFH